MDTQVDHAQEVARAFKNLTENNSVQYVRQVIEDNARLKREVEKIRAANELSDDKIIRLKTNLDRAHAESAEKDVKLAAQSKEKAALTAELNKKTKELDLNSKKILTLQADLKLKEAKITELESALTAEQQKTKDRDILAVSLESVTTELKDREKELQWLDGFSFKLTPLSRQDIASHLSNIFSSALSLAESYFSVDFPIELSKEQAPSWKKFKARTWALANPSPIPLPLKNSPAANKTRSAAFLAILASEVSDHIFQPIYFVNDGCDLSKRLSWLASTDPEMESYLRSVMFSSIPPDTQNEMIRVRVDTVVKNILDCVEKLLGPKQAQFQTDLTTFCDLAASRWQNIQHVREKVEPSFKLVWYEQPTWKSLPARDPSAPKAKTNGANGNARSSNKKSFSKPARADEHAYYPEEGDPGHVSDIRHIAAVVWPFFCVNDSDETEREVLLTQGYVLVEAEVKAAKDEETQILVSKTRRGSAAVGGGGGGGGKENGGPRRSRTWSLAGATGGGSGGGGSNGIGATGETAGDERNM